jgi:hypothetical protein
LSGNFEQGLDRLSGNFEHSKKKASIVRVGTSNVRKLIFFFFK